MFPINARLVESGQIQAAFVPVDMSGGANNGHWFDMTEFRRVMVLLFTAAGTTGHNLTVTLNQAQDNAGTGSKALNFTSYFKKESASGLTGVGQFTEVDQAAANTLTTNSADQALYAVEVLESDLDVNNGFNHIQVTVSQAGAAQVGGALYIGYLGRYDRNLPLSAAG